MVQWVDHLIWVPWFTGSDLEISIFQKKKNKGSCVGMDGRCRRLLYLRRFSRLYIQALGTAHTRMLQGLERSESTPVYVCMVLRQSQQAEGTIVKRTLTPNVAELLHPVRVTCNVNLSELTARVQPVGAVENSSLLRAT